MDVTKEIQHRLKEISKLLKEIEDILIGCEFEAELSEDCLCTCDCGQESNPDVLVGKPDHNEDADHNMTVEKKSTLSKHSGEQVKYDELDRKSNISDGVIDIESCIPNSSVRNHEMSNNLHHDRRCNYAYYNKQVNNVSKHCSNENFKRKLKDIQQRFMAQFDEINKDKTNTYC